MSFMSLPIRQSETFKARENLLFDLDSAFSVEGRIGLGDFFSQC